VRTAEAELEFRIPEPLRSIYLQISDGGFGPLETSDGSLGPGYGLGYGLIGVRGGPSPDFGMLVETYEEMKTGANDAAREENDPGLKWKTGVLPFCEWGSNIVSCVDCNDASHRIVQSEHCECEVQHYTLDAFFEMWLAGKSILDAGGGKQQTAEIINPFTGQKTVVYGARKKKMK
jgi:hypothetical protein